MTSTGAVYACGKNDDGELGDGGTTDSDVPVKVDLAAGTKVTAVVAGSGHSLAVTSTGAVLAWVWKPWRPATVAWAQAMYRRTSVCPMAACCGDRSGR